MGPGWGLNSRLGKAIQEGELIRENEGSVYERLGAQPAINAGGNTTTWGGSKLSRAASRAMEMANGAWVEMAELHEVAGELIAEIIGVDAAYVTAGCYSAMALSAAACIAGNDPEKRTRLPDTTGMKNEILLPRPHRYGFARAYLVPGGRLVEVGDDEACSPEQLDVAIGDNTAAVAYFVMPDWPTTVLSLDQAVEVAHARDVPVIADAASRNYPLDYFRQTAQSADLVCFSGKYLGAHQSTGFVCGKSDLVRAASAQGFPFGRAMKLDRQEIVGLVVAVEEWFSMNHEDRFASYGKKFDTIEDSLQGLPTIRRVGVERVARFPGVMLLARLDLETLGKTVQEVIAEMREGNPGIRVLPEGTDGLNINVHTLNDGEEQVVAERLKAVLGGES